MALVLGAALAGCASNGPDRVSQQDAQQATTVTDAVVLSTRAVVIEGSQSGIGAVAGTLIGSTAVSHIGGQREAMVIGMLGALVGGVIGNNAERLSTREDATEIVVQLKNGDRRAVIQALSKEQFATGEAVLLVAAAGRVRVVRPAPTAPVAPVAPSAPAAAPRS